MDTLFELLLTSSAICAGLVWHAFREPSPIEDATRLLRTRRRA
jgi:hypothetical protein